MADTIFNAQSQTLYFPDDHAAHHGKFKGMAQILKEHGYPNVNTLKAQCPNFKCQSINNNCCCHNILFHSADFINIPCLLMTHCRAAGIDILFLPKFHCELNFIEQVWGFAKWEYCKAPPSSKIEDVEINSKAALDKVPLLSMWMYEHLICSFSSYSCHPRFANHSLWYMDGYQHGMDGQEATWAVKKYHRHHQMPADATQEMIQEWMASKSSS